MHAERFIFKMERLPIVFDSYRKMLLVALRSIFLHKLRSALSILGVVCGVMAVLTMISIGEGARKEVLEGIRKLGTTLIYVRSTAASESAVYNHGASPANGLTLHDRDRIQSGCCHVTAVAAAKELSADIFTQSQRISTPVIACSDEYARILGLSTQQGRFIKKMDIEWDSKVCVLGQHIAEKMFENGRIGSCLRIGDDIFTVIGRLAQISLGSETDTVISKRNYNEMLFIPLGQERLLAEDATDNNLSHAAGLSELIVEVDNESAVSASVDIISRILEVAHNAVIDYEIIAPAELLAEAQKTQRTFNMVLAAIASIALLVGGIGIMNIMLASVSERTREIGIRRAVGASRQDILAQFLIESVAMTFIGGIVGVLLGTGAVCLISLMATWEMTINAWAVLVPLVLSVAVGLFFGIFPAVKAARMEPINALRHYT